MYKVSILIRTKNRNNFITRAIQSVINQTYNNWQIVIINNGGDNQGIVEVVDIYKKKLKGKIKLINLKEPKIGVSALNSGIKGSNSKYITILDDDDTWNKDFLHTTINFLENNKVKTIRGVTTQALRIVEEINNGSINILKVQKFNQHLSSVTIGKLASSNQFTVHSFVYKRNALKKVGLYDGLPVLGDWDFNLRFIEKYDIAVLPEPLSHYHQRPYIKDNLDSSNLVYRDKNLYPLYESLIRNKYLRKDIIDGKIGLGFLMSINHKSSNKFPKQDLIEDKNLYRDLEKLNTFFNL